MMDVVSVTGGSGGIGRALLEQLVGRYRVKALFRAKNDISEAWAARGCTPVFGDLESETALAELVHGSTYVFHCAALTSGAYEPLHQVNAEGTRRLARLAAQHGCRRFVHVSSISVYTASSAAPVYREDLTLQAHDGMAVYPRTKLESEQALQAVAREHGLDYVILRPTSVFGPHVKSFTLAPVGLMSKGLPVMVGDGSGLLDVVYVDDVARSLVLAAETPAASGEVFNIGAHSVTFNEFYGYYREMLRRPARHISTGIVNAALAVIARLPMGRRERGRELINGARLLVGMAESRSTYPSDKARALLGYEPACSLGASMLETELWLKASALCAPAPQSLPEYGPLPFRPHALVHATSEADIVHIVRAARRHRVTVRAIGSLHSPSRLPHTEGVCVAMHRYNQLVKVDGALVTVQAGMRIRDLNDALAGLGMALPANGSITAQTVSGAISTATHGGSVYHGSLSDYVEAVRMVRADGSVVDVDRSQRDLFPAVVVSLGVLGVLSTVTFRCVPAFTLESRNSVAPAQDVIDAFDEVTRRSLYTCITYFPITDQMEILAIDTVAGSGGSLQPGVADSAPPPAKPTAPGSAAVRPWVKGALRALAWGVRRSPALHRRMTRSSVGHAYTTRAGRSDRVLAFSDTLTSGRSPALLQDMEVAVRYEDAPAAIRALREHFRATGRYPLLPIHIRCATRSESWMSPAYQRDVCYLEFWQFPVTDTLFDEVHRVLEPFGYRFHWGKETRATRDYIRQQYERWDDFARLRVEWDPSGVFINSYLAPFFDTAPVVEPVSL